MYIYKLNLKTFISLQLEDHICNQNFKFYSFERMKVDRSLIKDF